MYVSAQLLVMYDSLQSFGLKPTRLLSPWDSPGKNTAVGCHTLLQEIFPTQGLSPPLLSPALQADSLPTEPPGKSDICIQIADAPCCTAETNNIVKQLYSDQRGQEKNLRGETHSKESTRKEGSVLNVTRQGAVTWKQRWPWKPYQMGPNGQGGRLRNQ